MTEKNLTINISSGTIVKAVLAFLILLFLYIIRETILLVFISFVLAAIIEPGVDLLEKKKIPRSLSTIFIYVVIFLFIYLIIQLLIPPITEQISLLISNFPSFWEKIVDSFSNVKQFSEEQGLVDNINQALLGLQTGLQQAASGVYSFIIGLFWNLLNLIIILTIAYYLVVEKDSAHNFFKAVFPEKYHDRLAKLFINVKLKIGDWARGQLILGLIIGFFSFVGLIFFIPRYALILALVAGLTEIIPYIGPIIGAIPAVFLAFVVPPVSLLRGLAVLVLYIIIQQAENNIIVPQVMRKTVGLHPVAIIVVMLIGAQIAGIIGLILSIPVATTINLVIKEFAQDKYLTKSEQKESNNN